MLRWSLLAICMILSAAGGIAGAHAHTDNQPYQLLAADLPNGTGEASDVGWDELLKINPDVVGWLSIGGAGISLPVVQAPVEKEESWYLTHDFWGRPNSLGCPYVDRRCSSDSRHIMVYGHTASDSGAMFSTLSSIETSEQLEHLDDATWSTPAMGEQRIRPLLSLEVAATYDPIQRFHFAGSAEIQEALLEIREDARAAADDIDERMQDVQRILTLVTCSSTIPFETMRTIIVFEVVE